MHKGYLLLVLHAHLPYVRHPEYDDFLEEAWFYEAITETYIPLLDVFEGLLSDGVDFRITMTITPSLISMFTDPLLQERYIKHMEKLIDLTEKEIVRTRQQPEFNSLAHMYNERFKHCLEVFVHKYHRNLTLGFKKIQDAGKLEIITCGATHGFFPLMDVAKPAVRAQVKIAAAHYEENFGRKPKGIWLAECAYQPGDDK
jgi:1,4-alpha-glucan branching enzyme